MQRFFVPPTVLSNGGATLGGEIAHQISRVLRMRAGDRIVLLDGLGNEFDARIISLDKNEVRCAVPAQRRGTREPGCRVALYMAILNKPDKFEWAIQKCTELGASLITPVSTERSVAGAPEKGRRERWERIIREAAEQSGRAILPVLGDAVPLPAVLDSEARLVSQAAGGKHLSLILALGATTSLKAALSGATPASVSLFIGPEGGFSAKEVEVAGERGVLPVGMGVRVLRAETAAVAALSIVMYGLGEMDTTYPSGRGDSQDA